MSRRLPMQGESQGFEPCRLGPMLGGGSTTLTAGQFLAFSGTIPRSNISSVFPLLASRSNHDSVTPCGVGDPGLRNAEYYLLTLATLAGHLNVVAELPYKVEGMGFEPTTWDL